MNIHVYINIIVVCPISYTVHVFKHLITMLENDGIFSAHNCNNQRIRGLQINADIKMTNQQTRLYLFS